MIFGHGSIYFNDVKRVLFFYRFVYFPNNKKKNKKLCAVKLFNQNVQIVDCFSLDSCDMGSVEKENHYN